MKLRTMLLWLAAPLNEWRQRRRARRLVDERLAAFFALPPEEQRKWIHPASPNKPAGWSMEEYRENQRRQRGPTN